MNDHPDGHNHSVSPFPRRASFLRWDGTQEPFPLAPEELFDKISDEILAHGDVGAVLRRLMYEGMYVEGRHLMGIREILRRLAARRRELLRRYDPSGLLQKIAERLEKIEKLEREGLAKKLQDAARLEEVGSEADRQAVRAFKERARASLEGLDLLPAEIPARLRAMQSHPFVTEEARKELESLLDELRRQASQLYFQQATQALQSMSPEDLRRMKDMLAELNKLLEQRERGEEPDFQGFMEKYGDFFPERPQNLDQLLRNLARRIAIARALMQGLPLEMQQELQQLVSAMLQDMELQFELDRLARNLATAFPELPWDDAIRLRGSDVMDFGEFTELAEALADLEAMEEVLQAADADGLASHLEEIDLDRVREMLGEEEALSLARLSRLLESLKEAGLIDRKGSRVELTPKALRRIGGSAIEEIFKRLRRSAFESHRSSEEGVGVERTFTTKPWEWGDGFNVNIYETTKNAIRKHGPGLPIKISVDDFEIDEVESLTRSATVLLLDLSLSMMMRDSFVAAKRLAFALHSLISSKFPSDYFSIVGFSELAREIDPRDLPEATWDGVYGTNMQHALMLARKMLKGKPAKTRQIIMVTDGEPTAHLEHGVPFFSYPPVAKTIEETMKEVLRCTKENITINVFMLDRSPHLVRFIQQMTKLNRGRAFFTTPENLGDFVLYDFLESKTKRARKWE
jgi:uncharacterized protein with von Willebrand factor type A (vWA) domain